jgi:hypothetical protein
MSNAPKHDEKKRMSYDKVMPTLSKVLLLFSFGCLLLNAADPPAANYGDAVTPIKVANALWLALGSQEAAASTFNRVTGRVAGGVRVQ